MDELPPDSALGGVAVNVVPFSMDNLYGGFAECEGLLRDEGDHICLEYRVKDSVAGWLKSGVKQFHIPVADLVSVTLTKSWLGTEWLGVKIVLQANRLDVFRDMPGASQGRVELSVARNDRDAAERFVAGLHEQGES